MLQLCIEIIPKPLLKGKTSPYKQLIEVIIKADNIIDGEKLILGVDENRNTLEVNLGELKNGINIKEIFLRERKKETVGEWIFKYSHLKVIKKVKRKPVRKWNISFVLHSHTDLGFTAPISDVVKIHNDNTDLAVLYAKETSKWPVGSRFKWTCEISWQLQNYLKDRNHEQVSELIKEIRKNNIEVGALYSGEHTDLLGHEEAIRSFYYAAELRRKYKINIDSALLSDVPGCTTGFVQIMAKAGIKNFNLADNNFIAPFLIRTDLPRPFYWLGDAGTKVLAWFTDHPFYAYIEGKNYGLADSYENTLEKLPEKLMSLEESSYPYDELQIQYAFDNFRIEFRPAAIVREWNSKWAYPKIQLSTIREFYDRMRAKYDEVIPKRKGDWTNWWGNIVTSYPSETAQSRQLHNTVPQLETIATSIKLFNNKYKYPNTFNSIYENNLAFDEHSGNGLVWEAENEEQQQKALREGYGYIHDALNDTTGIEESVNHSLSTLIKHNEKDVIKIAVFNTLNKKRSGLVEVSIKGKPINFSIIDGQNGESVNRFEKDSDKLKFYAVDVPAFGYKTYKLRSEQNGIRPKAKKIKPANGIYSIENDFYRLKINSTGKILVIQDKEARKKISGKYKHHFSSPVVFRPKVKKEIEMGRFIPDVYNGVKVPGESIDLLSESKIKILECDETNLSQIIKYNFVINKIKWLEQTIELPKHSKQINITYRIPYSVLYNKSLRTKLGNSFNNGGILYFAFPFNLKKPKFIYDAPCSVLEAGKNQFKGTCKDFYAINNWCQLKDERMVVNFSSKDLPIVDIGSFGLTQYKEKLDKNLSQLFVRALALNEGIMNLPSPYSNGDDFVFRFSFSSNPIDIKMKKETLRTANEFGLDSNQPLLGVKLKKNTNGINLTEASFIKISPPTVHIVTFKKAEDNDDLILRLKETNGNSSKIKIDFPFHKIIKANKTMITEENIENITVKENVIQDNIKTFEISTYRLKLKIR